MKDRRNYILALTAFIIVVAAIIVFPLKKPKKEVKPPKVSLGRIAIVLDDWGYSLNNVSLISQIKSPLTVAVLPDLAYSKKVSRDLHNRGFEVMLHLPMEPKEKYAMEKNTIRISMDEKQIRGIVARDLSLLDNVKGVNNHMGSMATSDLRTMGAVFKELKKRKLFFLDSYVIADSRCREAAKMCGLRFAKRDIFIDNRNEPSYIKQQLYKLKAKARKNGYAIGIGHDRRNTLQVLKEEMPNFEREGYRFVFVSELAE